jgi:hypothetical protein
MSIQNITQLLMDLQSISDSSLEQGLQGIAVNIDDDKFHNAFSAYGLSKLLLILDQDVLRGKTTGIPKAALEGIRLSGVFMIRTYVCLVYMRSEVLERGLDHVPASSPLRLFRDIFRSGCLPRGEDTIVQHMRNSLAHGSFHLSNDFATVEFKDRNWAGSFSVEDVFSLCEQVFRFYCAAFRVNRNSPTRCL